MASDIKSRLKEAISETATMGARAPPQAYRMFLRRLALKPLIIVALLLFAGAAIAAYQIYVVPRGEITAPSEGSPTARIVEIEGFTKNIPLEHQYIWITIDVPGLGLSWPKRQIYSINNAFKTKILERGPNAEFTVSLYAVPQFIHKDILDWIEDCRLTQTEHRLQNDLRPLQAGYYQPHNRERMGEVRSMKQWLFVILLIITSCQTTAKQPAATAPIDQKFWVDFHKEWTGLDAEDYRVYVIHNIYEFSVAPEDIKLQGIDRWQASIHKTLGRPTIHPKNTEPDRTFPVNE